MSPSILVNTCSTSVTFFILIPLFWTCHMYGFSSCNCKIIFLHIFIKAVLFPMAVPKSCSIKWIVESRRLNVGGYRQMVMLQCFLLNDLFLLLQSNNSFGFLSNLPEHFFLETATGVGLSLVTAVTTQDLVHVKGVNASSREIRQLDLK